MLAFESSFGVPAGPLMASLRKDTEKPAALAEAGIAVVCQFGVMFFADTIRAYRAVLRVLKSGGRFVFDVWDKIEENEFARLVIAEGIGGVRGRQGRSLRAVGTAGSVLCRAPRGRHWRPRCAGNSRTWVCQRTREADCPSNTKERYDGDQTKRFTAIRQGTGGILLVAPASHSNPAPGPHGTHIRSVRH